MRGLPGFLPPPSSRDQCPLRLSGLIDLVGMSKNSTICPERNLGFQSGECSWPSLGLNSGPVFEQLPARVASSIPHKHSPERPVVSRTPALVRLLWLVALLLAPAAGPALDRVVLEFARLEGSAWEASEVRIEYSISPEGAHGLVARVAELRLPAPLLALRNLRLRCSDVSFSTAGTDCPDGVLEVSAGSALIQSGFELSYTADEFVLELSETSFPGLHAGARIEGRPQSWQAELRARSDTIAELLAAVLGPDGESPFTFVAGSAALHARLAGGATVERVEVEVEFSSLEFSDDSGLRAAEDLAFNVRGTADRDAADWRFSAEAEFLSGALNFDSLFLQAAHPPQRVALEGRWNPLSRSLELLDAELRHPGILQLRAGGLAVLGDEPRLDRVRFELSRTSVRDIYETYLRDLAWDSFLGNLETGGEIELAVDWERTDGGEAQLSLFGIDLEDKAGRFAGYGLNGTLHWGERGEAEETRLAWAGGSLLKIDLGAGELVGLLHGRDFSLAQPLTLPVLDGRLEVRAFEANGLGSPNPTWRLVGDLGAISMESLTHALGWLPFSGTLAGSIPDVRYADGTITSAGTLVMRVFDGEVHIHDLELERPFGFIPVLRGDIDIRGLDLAPLTDAFSFGTIEGRIDGRVHDLVLQDWQPLSFDAQFQTPPDDDSPHRISQHAVESLAQLGGGSEVLSATVLRFFKEFSYDRLGIRCRLRNGVCDMGGISPGQQGYYIVKGGGLPPRIDVFGFNDRVAWRTLLERLKNIAASQGPIIR